MHNIFTAITTDMIDEHVYKCENPVCMFTQVFQLYWLIISKTQPLTYQETLESKHWAGCSTFNVNTFVEVLSIRKAILNTS